MGSGLTHSSFTVNVTFPLGLHYQRSIREGRSTRRCLSSCILVLWTEVNKQEFGSEPRPGHGRATSLSRKAKAHMRHKLPFCTVTGNLHAYGPPQPTASKHPPKNPRGALITRLDGRESFLGTPLLIVSLFQLDSSWITCFLEPGKKGYTVPPCFYRSHDNQGDCSFHGDIPI